jgi:hypothetical protein
MNIVMEVHKELSHDMESVIETISHPAFETMSDDVRAAVVKEFNRLEMLLELLEEDPLYERTVL